MIVFIGTFLGSCTKNITDINEDTKRPYTAPAEALFSNAQKNLVDRISSTNVNDNVFRLYAQQTAQCTYPDESQYSMTTRAIPDRFWNHMYRDVLKDLREAKSLITATSPVTDAEKIVKANSLAVITINESLCWQYLVDAFGDVPYTEAFNIHNTLPKYDDDQAVYTSVMDDLKAAIASLDVTQGSLGGNDFIYGGNTTAWKKFGNSLLLRMAMRIADADGLAAKSKSMAEAAILDGVFERNDDNATFQYLDAAPNTNPLYVSLVLSGRKDFVGSNTMIDMMNTLEDPRRDAYFQMTDTSTEDGVEKWAFVGGQYGYANSYSANSRLGSIMHTATFPGVIMNNAEIQFLLAEAAERGYNVGGDIAADLYKEAIEASFEEWGVSGAADYLARADVDYATATGSWQQKIATQKWLALYNRGFEAWTEWRRFDYPIFNIPDGLTYEDIPSRFIFPTTEATLNGTNYDAAAAKFNSDSPQAKIFWDKN